MLCYVSAKGTRNVRKNAQGGPPKNREWYRPSAAFNTEHTLT